MAVDLKNVLPKVCRDVEACIGIAVIDLEYGTLMGIHLERPLPQEVVDFLAAAAARELGGKDVKDIAEMLAAHKKKAATERKEVSTFTAGNKYHRFVRTKKNPLHVVCFVCELGPDVQEGMIVSRASRAMPAIEAAL